MAVYRHIRQDLGYAPALGNRLGVGDMILVMPTFMTQCLLDAYTCWSVCPGGGTIDYNFMNTFEGRRYRDALNGGLFGFGGVVELSDRVRDLLAPALRARSHHFLRTVSSAKNWRVPSLASACIRNVQPFEAGSQVNVLWNGPSG